jgi:hypothetical protein
MEDISVPSITQGFLDSGVVMNADNEKFEAIDYLIGQLRDLLETGKTYDEAVTQLKKTCLPDILDAALKQFENLQI